MQTKDIAETYNTSNDNKNATWDKPANFSRNNWTRK